VLILLSDGAPARSRTAAYCVIKIDLAQTLSNFNKETGYKLATKSSGIIAKNYDNVK